MKLFSTRETIKDIEPTVIALGNFDGVHKGHQKLIAQAVQYAKGRGLKSAVFTFSNQPKNVIAGSDTVKGILYPDEKAQIIESLDVDYLFNMPFDETIMHMAAKDFIDELLRGKMKMRAAYCGFNYRFGHKAEGRAETLMAESLRSGFGLNVLPPYKVAGQIVSSSLIRANIESGDMELCATLMGRPYAVGGEVVVGNRIGKSIGFPTSNLLVDESMVSPAHGVYITSCVYQGTHYPSITNVGVKPTVGAANKNMETHIFNFDKELYGKTIRVEFLKKMRDEQKFRSVRALTKQIKKDCLTAKAFHESFPCQSNDSVIT